ncbi:MAG: FimB/Mfa2 family fimbrial subunit [Porphyromonas sp.]|nr:FimB/Mfa2 family fimbrial subunit [Porphyromonas sp.]
MKIFPLRYLVALLAFLLLPGCNSIYENLDNCPVYLVVKPYMQTPCMDAPSYPENVERLHVTLSDANGKVVAHQLFVNARLAADASFVLEIPASIYKEGTYTCSVWGGAVNEDYLFSGIPEVGLKIRDLNLSLRTNTGRIDGKIFHKLYQSTQTLTLPSKATLNGIDKVYTSPNLRPYTYDFNINVTGMSAELPAEIAIADENLSYVYTGELSTPRKAVEYAAILPSAEPVRSVHLRTLDIMPSDTDPRLKLINKRNGDTLLNLSLKGLLRKLPHYRPECKFEYDVDIEFRTSMSVVILIDGMPVHSYDIDL